jgi:NAD(P)-dependent dehydrogenase (short-subunit alcohol dehydrogenase family)
LWNRVLVLKNIFTNKISSNLSLCRLEGKVAIITGGASGIGAATAKLFVQHGAKVVIADIQDEVGQSLCNELGRENILYVHCNVTIESDIKNVVDTVVSNYGKLDIMFNNAAGISDDKNREILNYDSELSWVLSMLLG